MLRHGERRDEALARVRVKRKTGASRSSAPTPLRSTASARDQGGGHGVVHTEPGHIARRDPVAPRAGSHRLAACEVSLVGTRDARGVRVRGG